MKNNSHGLQIRDIGGLVLRNRPERQPSEH